MKKNIGSIETDHKDHCRHVYCFTGLCRPPFAVGLSWYNSHGYGYHRMVSSLCHFRDLDL